MWPAENLGRSVLVHTPFRVASFRFRFFVAVLLFLYREPLHANAYNLYFYSAIVADIASAVADSTRGPGRNL